VCIKLVQRWQSEPETATFPIAEWKSLNVAQQIEVLTLLLIGPDLSLKKVENLGKSYELEKSKNCEIRLRLVRKKLRELITLKIA